MLKRILFLIAIALVSVSIAQVVEETAYNTNTKSVVTDTTVISISTTESDSTTAWKEDLFNWGRVKLYYTAESYASTQRFWVGYGLNNGLIYGQEWVYGRYKDNQNPYINGDAALGYGESEKYGTSLSGSLNWCYPYKVDLKVVVFDEFGAGAAGTLNFSGKADGVLKAQAKTTEIAGKSVSYWFEKFLGFMKEK